MVAYWVARSKVNDPEQYKKYADLAPAGASDRPALALASLLHC